VKQRVVQFLVGLCALYQFPFGGDFAAVIYLGGDLLLLTAVWLPLFHS